MAFKELEAETVYRDPEGENIKNNLFDELSIGLIQDVTENAEISMDNPQYFTTILPEQSSSQQSARTPKDLDTLLEESSFNIPQKITSQNCKEVYQALNANLNPTFSLTPDLAKDALSSEITLTREAAAETSKEIIISMKNILTLKQEIKPKMNSFEKPVEEVRKYAEEYHNLTNQQNKLNNLNEYLKTLHEQKEELARNCQGQSQKEFDKNSAKLGMTLLAGAKAIMQNLRKGITEIGNILHERNQKFRDGVKDVYHDVGDKAELLYEKLLLQQRLIGRWFQDKIAAVEKQQNKMTSNIKNQADKVVSKAQLGTDHVKNAITRESLSTLLTKAQLGTGVMTRTEGEGKGIAENLLYNLALDNCRRDLNNISNLLDSRINEMEIKQLEGKTIDKNELTYFKGLRDIADGKPMSAEKAIEFSDSMKKCSKFQAIDREALANALDKLQTYIEGKNGQLFSKNPQAKDDFFDRT